MKRCKKCKLEKDESCFYNSGYKDGLNANCKDCVIAKSAKYYKENKNDRLSYAAKYQQDNKEEIKEYHSQYYEDNKEALLNKAIEYQQEHKEERKEYGAGWRKKNKVSIAIKGAKNKKKRLKTDSAYKFRENFSALFRAFLKSNNINKDRNSTFDILGYTPDEIREHLYSQFADSKNLDHNGKIWMTPENQGVYRVGEWDENDSSTWKWQVDHIKPQADFNCQSKEDPLLKECWSLDNLRPLKAKDNLLDGVRRTRHIKK